MGRPRDWKPPPGTDAVAIIGPAIRASSELIGITGIKYESRDFRTGVDTDAMQLVSPTIKQLLGIGLHFDQGDIETAIKVEVHQKEAYTAAVRQQCANHGKSENELLFDSAYCLRTILAHTIMRFKQHEKFLATATEASRVCEKTNPAWLRELYPLVKQHDWEDPSPMKPKKKKPFIFSVGLPWIKVMMMMMMTEPLTQPPTNLSARTEPLKNQPLMELRQKPTTSRRRQSCGKDSIWGRTKA